MKEAFPDQFSHAQRLIHAQADKIVAARQDLSGLVADARDIDRQEARVQPQHRGRALHFNIDIDRAAESAFGGPDRQLGRVAQRAHRIG